MRSVVAEVSPLDLPPFLKLATHALAAADAESEKTAGGRTRNPAKPDAQNLRGSAKDSQTSEPLTSPPGRRKGPSPGGGCGGVGCELCASPLLSVAIYSHRAGSLRVARVSREALLRRLARPSTPLAETSDSRADSPAKSTGNRNDKSNGIGKRQPLLLQRPPPNVGADGVSFVGFGRPLDAREGRNGRSNGIHDGSSSICAVAELVLEPSGWEVLACAQVHSLPPKRRLLPVPLSSGGGSLEFAAVGLRALLNGGGAVLAVSFEPFASPRAREATAAAASATRALAVNRRQPRRGLGKLWPLAVPRARPRAVGLAAVVGAGELVCLCSANPSHVALVRLRADAAQQQPEEGGRERGVRRRAGAEGLGALALVGLEPVPGSGRAARWTYETDRAIKGAGALVVVLPDENAGSAEEPRWLVVVTI
mmetsp:Transcript_23276/g.55140  ORF Transcript_23276/g.55140 Transcript_23276/m.55140 type:complete len:424 (+) Transcript_23276:323-1594(+)